MSLMARCIPYDLVTGRATGTSEAITARLRGAFDRETWMFRGRGNTFFIRRRIGWRRMPSLPLAYGILISRGATTDVRVTIRLSWPAYLFGVPWMAAAIAGSALAAVAAVRTGNPEPLVALVLPVGGWLTLAGSFRSEARLIRERLATVFSAQHVSR